MSTTNELINLIAEMAMQIDKSGSIVDFGTLQVDEEAVFHLMATNVIEGYYDMFNGSVMAMATVTALVVENFVLQLMLENNGVQRKETGL
jgi:hypothetical protein